MPWKEAEFSCLCMHMCTCMHVCVHVCMIFVGVGGRVRVCVTQRITLGIIPQEQSTLFSVTVSH